MLKRKYKATFNIIDNEQPLKKKSRLQRVDVNLVSVDRQYLKRLRIPGITLKFYDAVNKTHKKHPFTTASDIISFLLYYDGKVVTVKHISQWVFCNITVNINNIRITEMLLCQVCNKLKCMKESKLPVATRKVKQGFKSQLRSHIYRSNSNIDTNIKQYKVYNNTLRRKQRYNKYKNTNKAQLRYKKYNHTINGGKRYKKYKKSDKYKQRSINYKDRKPINTRYRQYFTAHALSQKYNSYILSQPKCQFNGDNGQFVSSSNEITQDQNTYISQHKNVSNLGIYKVSDNLAYHKMLQQLNDVCHKSNIDVLTSESKKYTADQITNMQNFISYHKKCFKIKREHETVWSCKTSHKQILAFHMIKHHYEDLSIHKQPLFMIIYGACGVGKSWLIKACKNMMGNKCMLLASNGKAAFNISGHTTAEVLSLPIGKLRRQKFPNNILLSRKRALQDIWSNNKDIQYIFIDEFSMIDQAELSFINERLNDIFSVEDGQYFGNKSVILVGDFALFSYASSSLLYDTNYIKETSLRKQHGRNIYFKLFNKCVYFDQNIEQSNNEFFTFLNTIRNGNYSKHQYKNILSRYYGNLRVEEKCNFDNSTSLVVSHKTKEKINITKLMTLTALKIKICAINNPRIAEDASFTDAQDICNHLYICRGAKVRLTCDQWIDAGLYKGCNGEVVDLIYNWKQPNVCVLVAILVKFYSYIGPVIKLNNIEYAGVVPIVPYKVAFYYKGQVCTRQNFPLALNWASTFQESLHQTLCNGRIDLEDGDLISEHSYIAFSRFKKFSEWIIESVSYDRINKRKCKAIKDRLAEEIRLKQMENTTINCLYKTTTDKRIKTIISNITDSNNNSAYMDNADVLSLCTSDVTVNSTTDKD